MNGPLTFYLALGGLVGLTLLLWVIVSVERGDRALDPVRQLRRSDQRIYDAHREARKAMNRAADQGWRNRFE